MDIGGLLGQLIGMPPGRGGVPPFGMGAPPTQFCRKFIPLPPAYWQTEDPSKLERGDKIVLPPSALDQLSQMNIQFPIMFEVKNDHTKKTSHCSVLEFTAPEGNAYVPVWMFDNLQMDPDSMDNRITLRNVPLSKGTFVKLQPHSYSFTELSNPRALLEVALRGFSCLTKGDTIQISPTGLRQKYLMDIIELKPANQVSIIETDIKVEFAPPKDMHKVKKQQEEQKRKEEEEKKIEEEKKADSKEKGDEDSEDELLGGLFADNRTGPKPKKSGKSAYWSRLGSTGQKLNGKPAGSSNALPGSKKKKVEEIVGNMRYIYEVDEATGEKTVIRRLPMRKLPAGKGHALGES